jgi:hypothetical protein
MRLVSCPRSSRHKAERSKLRHYKELALANLINELRRRALFSRTHLLLLGAVLAAASTNTPAQERDREDEIVANLAGGRVIVHVARDMVLFAAIDQPIEDRSIPPRVMELDSTHVGVILGASEWRSPADPKPVRMDRDLPRMSGKDSKYEGYGGEAEPDLETIGIGFLEKLRPLISRLHHKLDLPADLPLFEVVVIGYAPKEYGPEVWTIEYRIEQEEIATRGDFWQTRVLRPRFTQLYPPEKHAPHTLVETRYPADLKGATLLDLIQGNDPKIAGLRSSDVKFAKVLDTIEKGQAQKAVAIDSADFLRAVLPLIAGNSRFVLGKMEDQRGFDWIVAPDEPIEKVKEDKNRPPEAPTLRRKPKPQP